MQAHGGALEEVSEFLLTPSQSLFRPLTLDKLPDLAADGRHQLEQIFVRLPDLVAEELDDAQDLIAQQDGEAERAVEPFRGGEGRTREVVVLDHVGNPGRLAAGPDAAGQADPRIKGPLTT